MWGGGINRELKEASIDLRGVISYRGMSGSMRTEKSETLKRCRATARQNRFRATARV